MDNYQELLDWLFVQIPNYQRTGGPAYKPGLQNIQKLLRETGNPQKLFSSIHLAGTNGKGSVAHMLSAMYQENGYKVGIFTSPHISDFRERIKINGEMVSKEFVYNYIEANKALFEEIGATFFEITTAMAFEAFKMNEVDIAIVETGMGGRLDSTNVLRPELSIITHIAKDHSKYLGDTLVEIAGEKAGIIKEGVPVLVANMSKDLEEVFEKKAEEQNTSVQYPKDVFLEVKLLGRFQQKNALLAYQAVQILKDKWPVKDEKCRVGLINIPLLTGFKGRLQLLQSDPFVLVDAAHNPAGVKNLFTELSYMSYDRLHCVFGASNDKELHEMFKHFDKNADYYFTEFNSPRSSSAGALEIIGEEFGLNFTTYHSPERALDVVLSAANESDIIIVFGSFFILEDVFKMGF